MLIRYHLIYYAFGVLCLTVGRMIHPLFYVLFIFYCLWLFKRLDGRYVVVMFIIACILFLIPSSSAKTLPSEIEGRVMKVSQKYCLLKTDYGMIQLYHQEELKYLDDIVCNIEIMPMHHARNDFAFDEIHYLKSLNVHQKAKMISLNKCTSHYRLYHWIVERLSSNQDVADYQRLLLLGEKNDTISDDYALLTDLSLVHLFALSGMHVHILCVVLKQLLGKVFHQKVATLITYIILGIYVFSIPMSISLYRAFFVLVLSSLLKKWFNSLDVLCLLVILYMALNPYIIFNPSFIFSYFVYFIVLMTSSCKRAYIYIYLSTIPLICLMNSQVSILSLLLGLLMMPFIEWLYMSILGSLFFSALEVMVGVMVSLLKKMIMMIGAWDSYFIIGHPTLLFIVFFYGLYFLMLYKDLRKQSIKVCVIGLCCLMVVFRFYNEYKIYGEVTMIDVGQGDCTLIRLPMNQGNILVDTGGNKNYDIATKTIIPYLKGAGIHRLDYVYISHDDYDHSGALESLMEHFDVKYVIRDFEKERMIGKYRINMFSYDVGEEKNDQSLVMQVDFIHKKMLMMGDASMFVEEQLLAAGYDLKADILKVSHHGSRTASLPAFIQAVSPDIALIGVGLNNMYNHPHYDVVERLKRKGAMVLRTDLDGMFHLRFYGESWYIFQ